MNVPPLLAVPVQAGLCKFEDIYRLPLDAFLDMNEILIVKAENERRYFEYERSKGKQ